jgi:hypothetical protein
VAINLVIVVQTRKLVFLAHANQQGDGLPCYFE